MHDHVRQLVDVCVAQVAPALLFVPALLIFCIEEELLEPKLLGARYQVGEERIGNALLACLGVNE